MDLKLINWVKDGPYRITTLNLLSSKPMLPSELAAKLDINRASMSRILRDLNKGGLVTKILSNSRTITHKITPKGRKLLQSIEGVGGE